MMLTYKRLKTVANESLINPKDKCNPMAIVLETGSYDYRVRRAIELARMALMDSAVADRYLKDAITLLIIARAEGH